MNIREATVEDDDPAFSAGYKIVEDNASESDGRHGAAPWWFGWGIRHAFWAGVLWSRAQQQAERDARYDASPGIDITGGVPSEEYVRKMRDDAYEE